MGNLFSNYNPVSGELQNEKVEAMIAYERHYHELVRQYKTEIQYIGDMLKNIRVEREEFYMVTLPKVELILEDDPIITNETKKEWILEFKHNMEKSFEQSEYIINHYISKNLEEFKKAMEEII